MNFENDILNKYIISSKSDLKGNITDVSEAFCKITGYTREELIGKPHSIVRHEDSHEVVFKKMWALISSDKVWTGIIKNKKKNGESYWVDSFIEPLYEDGKKIGYVSVRFDVTSNYHLAEINTRLNHSLRKYEKLFDSIDSGVAVVDKFGKYIEVNQYMCDLFGYTKEEFLEGNLLEKHSDESKINELFDEMVKNLFNLNKVEEKECETKDGKKIWIRVKYRYFAEDKIIITIQDISSEHELSKASALLLKQSKDADMGEMISMIAHQWRQPLSTIKSILTKMKVKRELKMYASKDLTMDSEKISSIIEHLSKTIDFFRDYLKPKTGIHEDFIKIFKGVNNIVGPLCLNAKIDLKIKYDKNEKFFVDDRIDQVLLNLIKNSIDAYESNEKSGDILIEIFSKNEKFILKVSDEAGGVDKKIIDKILEPYFSTKSKNGTGLGLYMCKNIVQDILGGSFYFENKKDGISFFVELPKFKKEN